MSMAMPWGRSVVTLQGPSLAWRSASARRWRTESSVQASLRTMAECMASASESETRVMGMPRAWAHDTTITIRTARFTITDCTGYQVDGAGRVLNRFGETTNGQPVPLVKPWDRQPNSSKLRRKLVSVPGLRRISGQLSPKRLRTHGRWRDNRLPTRWGRDTTGMLFTADAETLR